MESAKYLMLDKSSAVHIAVQLKEYEITDCVNSAQVILTIPMYLFI